MSTLESFLVLDRRAVSNQRQLVEQSLRSALDSWIVSITDRFQYGQKNKNGDGRWVALHDKDNKPYQVRTPWRFLTELLLTYKAPVYDCHYPRQAYRGCQELG